MEVRLQKYLADQGVCSRREGEKLIAQGLVKVNGQLITEQGVKIDPAKDQVEVNQKALRERKEQKVVYALHKPLGYVCSTHRTKVEKNIVLDLLPNVPERVYPVGRLDKDTTGLILLTNDGELAFRLTHPSFEHSKKYLVESNRPLSQVALDKLQAGVSMLGGRTQPMEIERLSATKFIFTLKEGKNRQIRRMVRKMGGQVKRLERIQIGRLTLEQLNLPLGKYRQLSAQEIELLER